MSCSAACARSLLFAASVAALWPATVRAEAVGSAMTFSELLRRFAAMPGLEARFREEKRIALLEAPLVSEGTLHFAPPDALVRRIQSPTPTTVIIDGGQLRYGDGRRTGQVDLDANPLVRHFVESFVYLLAGDEAAIRRLYDVTFTPSADGWELVLVPRREAMRRVLREVRVRGRGVVISQTRILEVSGDETLTTFTDVNTARRYTAAERARLLRLPPP